MAKKPSSANIIALGFKNLAGAEYMLGNVHVWQEKGYFTVKDAVVITKGAGVNDLQIKQTVKKTGKWALGGGGIGFLAGLLLGGPVGGVIVGATVGAISGALKDSGIDDNFIHVIGASMYDDTSALLVMVEPNPNRNEEEFAQALSDQQATVISTSLSPEREAQLRSLLSGQASVAPTGTPDLAAPSSQPSAAGPEATIDDGFDAETDAGPQVINEVTAETGADAVPEADPALINEVSDETSAQASA